MEKYVYDEKNDMNYELIGDYYYPCITVLEAPKVGIWGMQYHKYLRNNKKVLYTSLLLSGELNTHLEEIDKQAETMFNYLVTQFKTIEGITEQLKANDQIEWVRQMNSIRNRAAEVIYNNLICFI